MIDESNLKIAVIGADISDIMSAYLLGRRHRVTIFEKNDNIGGHTNTAVVGDGTGAGSRSALGHGLHRTQRPIRLSLTRTVAAKGGFLLGNPIFSQLGQGICDFMIFFEGKYEG